MSVNHEVKGTLARLLATENLIIEHKKVPTASFDVLRRVLTLPIWDRASGVVYDLLVGHEVGHALYTPNEDWTKKVPSNVPKDYVNVVEDARIEKLMKRKFPGLARTFYNGYSELNRDDFFCIADEDVSKMSLIDRINLHFKIGAYARIPFNEKESMFVEMIEGAETFDEVLRICEELANYTKNEAVSSIDIQFDKAEIGGSGGSSEGQGDQQFEINGDGSMTQGEALPEDPSESNENDQNKNNGPQNTGAEGAGPKEESVDEQTSKTQEAFDKKAQNLTGFCGTETYYVERPKLKMDHVIADYKVLLDHINESFAESQERYTTNGNSGSVFSKVDAEYKKYRTEAQKEVNYLVKEFEMKKSADAYQRMSTARTGVLDTSKLHTYKYNEDLFRKVSVIPDGKNHGLVFVLDWSGSMNDYLLDTVKQLLNLVWFCKKVQIPFEVYAFTYEWSNSYVDENYSTPKSLYKQQDGVVDVHRRFRLLNFLSSRSNSKILDECILNLWRLAAREDSSYNGYTWNSYNIPHGLDLSGTPLNESIIALHQIIPDFKTRNKLQKVNVVILTDGEGNNLNYNVNVQKRHGASYDYLGMNYISQVNALRDRKIGHVYRNFDYSDVNSNLTAVLLENLKDNFPEVNLIGFRIMSGSGFSYMYRDFVKHDNKAKSPDDIMKEWRKEKSCELNGMGYDALYAISSSGLSADTTMTVNEDATTADIGRAFRSMLKKKTTNKKLLSSFASLVS
jgi:hypothetical protein